MAIVEKANSSTTVKQLDESIKALDKLNSPKFKKQKERLLDSRQKLVSILNAAYKNKDFLTYSMGTSGKTNKAQYEKDLIELMRNNYAKMSINNLNIAKTNSVERRHWDKTNANYNPHNSENLNSEADIAPESSKFDSFVEFMEGKKGINFTTIIKSSLTVAAAAGLVSLGALPAIGTLAAALFAANPVVAVCAGVIGVAGLAKLANKVFGAEIRSIAKTMREKREYNKASAQMDANDFDAEKIINNADEQEKQQRDEAEKQAQEQKAKKDQETQLATNIKTFKPKSIEEVEAFKAQYDKIPTEVNNAIKTAGIDFGQMFKAEAFKLVRDGKQQEIDVVRAKFGEYLSAADMDNLQKAAGLERQDEEDFSHEYNQVKNNENATENNTARKGYKSNKDSFKEFKDNYNAIVTEIVSNKNQAKAMKDIKSIKEFINNDLNFNVAGKPNAAESKNLKTLCEKMVQMLEELQEQVITKGAKFSDDKEAKDKIAEAHGLKAEDLENLLN